MTIANSEVPPFDQWTVATQTGEEYSPQTVLEQFGAIFSTLELEKRPVMRKNIAVIAQGVLLPLYNIVSKSADTAELLKAEQDRLTKEWINKNGGEEVTGVSDYQVRKQFVWDSLLDEVGDTTRDVHVEDAIVKMTRIFNIIKSVVAKR